MEHLKKSYLFDLLPTHNHFHHSASLFSFPLQPIKHDAALKLGLVDEVVPLAQLLTAAKARALDIAGGRKPRISSLSRTDR